MTTTEHLPTQYSTSLTDHEADRLANSLGVIAQILADERIDLFCFTIPVPMPAGFDGGWKAHYEAQLRNKAMDRSALAYLHEYALLLEADGVIYRRDGDLPTWEVTR